MAIPSWITILTCIFTFAVAMVLYFIVDPVRRVWNVYFGLAVGAVVMAIANIALMGHRSPSLWLFLAAVAWCGATLYQIKIMPKRPAKNY